MEYTITAITRDQIPNNMFIYSKCDTDPNNNIFLFQFSNNFQLVYESDIIITNIDEIIGDITHYYNLWNTIKDEYNTLDEFNTTTYYLEKYNKWFLKDDYESFWNFHITHIQLINLLVIYYEIETSYDELSDDEGICVDEDLNI